MVAEEREEGNIEVIIQVRNVDIQFTLTTPKTTKSELEDSIKKIFPGTIVERLQDLLPGSVSKIRIKPTDNPKSKQKVEVVAVGK